MKPKRIGILLTGDYSWAGGLYYSLNIIKLLLQAPKTEGVEIIAIINNSTPADTINEIKNLPVQMAHLNKKNVFYRLLHKLKKDRFAADINALSLDVLYPLIYFSEEHKKITCKVIYWVYDLQHKFLPHLFTNETIQSRNDVLQTISTNAKHIVFSSYDSQQHFLNFYPNTLANLNVFQFVSLLDDYKRPSQKLNANNTIPYFIVCNQFWPHKNHLLVLEALKITLQKTKNCKIVFTGKFDESPENKYTHEIKLYIQQFGLQNHITFAGFISREKQIELMGNALAIIQPSLFEGWSTVVEDAKALNQQLLLSDIDVHKEQAENFAHFFSRTNATELSQLLIQVIEQKPLHNTLNYSENIRKAKDTLVEIMFVTKN